MVSRFFGGRGGLTEADAAWDAGSRQKADPDPDVNADAGSGRNDDPDADRDPDAKPDFRDR